PYWLTQPGGLRRLTPGRRAGPRAPAARAQRVQAAARGDPVQPGPDRGPALKAAEALPGRQQRLLQCVLRVLHRPEARVAVPLQSAPARADELAERLPAPGLGPRDQVRAPPATLPVVPVSQVLTPPGGQTGRSPPSPPLGDHMTIRRISS